MSNLEPIEEELLREEKLPGWARDRIIILRRIARQEMTHTKNLRATIVDLEEQISAAAHSDEGPKDSRAWLWREVNDEVLPSLGLGADPTIEFTPTGADGVTITVSVEGGGIKISSTAPLVIVPLTGRGDMVVKPVTA